MNSQQDWSRTTDHYQIKHIKFSLYCHIYNSLGQKPTLSLKSFLHSQKKMCTLMDPGMIFEIPFNALCFSRRRRRKVARQDQADVEEVPLYSF